jgi:glycerol-3-phosphate O-acyltransferase
LGEDRNPAVLAILDTAIEAGLDEYLALTTSMHDLVIAAKPVSQPPNDVVIVRSAGSLHPASNGNVLIETISHLNKTTAIERPVGEAVPLFWRFMREVYGLSFHAEATTNRLAQRARYHSDEEVLARIGQALRPQATVVEVLLPSTIAEAAVAAWEREETADAGHESHSEAVSRSRAGALALIGLAIKERGRVDGDSVVVSLDAWQIGDALNAADELGLLE